MRDGKEPGAQSRRVGQLADSSPGDQERFLGQILGGVGVGGFQIQAREDQPGGPADQLLERLPVARLALTDQRLVAFVHAASPMRKKETSFGRTRRAKSFKPPSRQDARGIGCDACFWRLWHGHLAHASGARRRTSSACARRPCHGAARQKQALHPIHNAWFLPSFPTFLLLPWRLGDLAVFFFRSNLWVDSPGELA